MELHLVGRLTLFSPFRNRHITQPKSTTASQSAVEINRELKIEAHLNKVGPLTEQTHYTDDFFLSQDIVINALDNVETRMYMDTRCVTNQKPLLESGEGFNLQLKLKHLEVPCNGL